MSESALASRDHALEMHYDFLAARIWQGLCSDDIDLVRSYFREVDPDDLFAVYSKVQHDVACRLDTPRLDSGFKRTLRSMSSTLGILYRDVQLFNYRKLKIFEMPDNYARYWNEMTLYGMKPDHWEVWSDKRDVSLSVVR